MTGNILAFNAALARAHKTGDPLKIEQARRNLAAAQAEKAIRQALATAPPLTAEQRNQLAGLLRGDAR